MQHIKQLLLGDEALALGAINAGLSGVYAYPGTPSTEITEYIQSNAVAKLRAIHSHWSSNEKTAMEEALGMSFCGRRSMVCMKHVGMNVCADPFVNSAMTGTNGGLIVVAADDPSMHSSQNEQDSRFYSDFAFIPTFEPSNQQEAYDMAAAAFDLSEKWQMPVMMRMVTRLCHSRAVVCSDAEAAPERPLSYPVHTRQWVLMPGNSKVRYKEVLSIWQQLQQVSETSPYNKYIDAPDHSMGIIASGIAYNYLMENYPDGCPYPVVKISQYPLPKAMIQRLAAECPKILVIEEGQPFIEDRMRGIIDHGTTIIGRLSGELPRTGELTPDAVRLAVGLPALERSEASEIIAPRPPALCQGCGHRDVYHALNDVMAQYPNPKVFGDIGCYTLGWLAPFNAIDSVVDMGASITMAKGAADAGQHPSIAVIGDSTFTHSGMTGLLDAINENSDITVIISDNLTTGMTGGQDSQGTGKLEDICRGLGADPAHVRTIDSLPRNHDQMMQLFKEEIEYHGLSVIVSRRECIQTARRHAAAAAKKQSKA
ncbi:MAG: thiamine pyrophosphate-dependent enzyme [Muribaculaceae bacterium]